MSIKLYNVYSDAGVYFNPDLNFGLDSVNPITLPESKSAKMSGNVSIPLDGGSVAAELGRLGDDSYELSIELKTSGHDAKAFVFYGQSEDYIQREPMSEYQRAILEDHFAACSRDGQPIFLYQLESNINTGDPLFDANEYRHILIRLASMLVQHANFVKSKTKVSSEAN